MPGQVDGTQTAILIGEQRLFAAIVDIEAIGVKGMDAGDPRIVHNGLPARLYSDHLVQEPFPVHPPTIGFQTMAQPGRLLSVDEADPLGEPGQIFSADDQFVPTADHGQPARLSVLINCGDDTQPVEHPLYRLQQGKVGMSQTD